MASIIRVKARWQGFQGAPGYTIFHMRDFAAAEPTVAEADAAITRVKAFFTGIAPYLPAVVQVQVENDIEVIEETTGDLVNILSAASTSAVTGGAASGSPYAAPVGAVVTWRTTVVRNNRRIRGRSFLVPLSSTAFENNGTLVSTALTVINNAATALINPAGAPDLGVWARPTVPGANDGLWAAVSSFSVPDMGSVLRSRRD